MPVSIRSLEGEFLTEKQTRLNSMQFWFLSRLESYSCKLVVSEKRLFKLWNGTDGHSPNDLETLSPPNGSFNNRYLKSLANLKIWWIKKIQDNHFVLIISSVHQHYRIFRSSYIGCFRFFKLVRKKKSFNGIIENVKYLKSNSQTAVIIVDFNWKISFIIYSWAQFYKPWI